MSTTQDKTTKTGKVSNNGKKGRAAVKSTIEVTKTGWSTSPEYEGTIDLEYLLGLPPFMESRDEGGNMAQYSVRLPEYLARVITSLRENKATPYKVNADVVRDCIYQGLHNLTCKYGGVNALLTESKLSQATDVAGESRRLHIRFSGFVEELVYLSEHDDAPKAKEIFINYVEQIEHEEREWTKKKMISLITSNSTTRIMLATCSDKVKKILGQ